jgi:predicted small integral membrane protein
MNTISSNKEVLSNPYSLLPKIIYLYGFGMWMTIITINNINDPTTNTIFINNMLEMNLFDPASEIGNGLTWRSIYVSGLARVLLWGVILLEVIIDILMWRALFSVVRCAIKKKPLDWQIIGKVNLALSFMLLLFSLFITGGMWFAYWVHQGTFQMVHLIAFMISLLGLIFFNQDTPKRA